MTERLIPEADLESVSSRLLDPLLTRLRRMRLTVTSRLPANNGDSKILDVSEDDAATDVILRTCMVMGRESEPRMYLELEDGTEIAGDDKIGAYIKNKDAFVSLRTRRVSPLRWSAALLTLLAGVVLVITGAALYSAQSAVPQYGVVIDAGSSHTSALLFTWDGEKVDGTGLVSQVNECNQGTGIDSFHDNPEAVKAFIEPCLVNTSALVPAEQVHVTRIFLGATAGMRILYQESPEQADAILGNMTEALRESPFLYEEGDCRIISGEEEGGFGWVSINVITDGIVPPATNTQSSLDMGGASAQIAYKDDGAGNMHYELYGTHYDVESSSMLCYGLQEAMRRYVALLVYDDYKANNDAFREQISNPCVMDASNMLKDSWLPEFMNNKTDIFGSECTDSLNDAQFMDALQALPDDYVFEHVAAYDRERCLRVVGTLLNKSECESAFASGDCFDPAVYPAPPSGGFYAMSSYYWEFSSTLGFVANPGLDATNADIAERCEQPTACQSCSSTDCFEVVYIQTTLLAGYHFDNATYPAISFVENINGEEASWALGLMTVESNDIPSYGTTRKLDVLGMTLMVTFGSLMVCMAAVALFMFHKRHNDRQLKRAPR